VIAADSWFLSPVAGAHAAEDLFSRTRGQPRRRSHTFGVHGGEIKAPQQLRHDQQTFGLGKAGADTGVRPLAKGYVGAVGQLTLRFPAKNVPG
jgi:hypothetical protein